MLKFKPTETAVQMALEALGAGEETHNKLTIKRMSLNQFVIKVKQDDIALFELGPVGLMVGDELELEGIAVKLDVTF